MAEPDVRVTANGLSVKAQLTTKYHLALTNGLRLDTYVSFHISLQ